MSMIKQQQSYRVLGLASVVLGASLLLTACGGDEHHQVKAVDKVDEAAELAKANAPEPEELEFEENDAPVAETTEVEANEEDDVTDESSAVADDDTVEVVQVDTDAQAQSDVDTENTEEVVAE